MIAADTWSHIELTSGVSSGPSRSECAGIVQLDFQNIGRRMFFIDAVEADGGRIGMHDCFSYEEAIIAAEEIAREEGIHVVDLVMGGAA